MSEVDVAEVGNVIELRPATPVAPDVSIVLICFNDARRVGRAIRSLVNQTLRNLEIIVVDDASTDDTEQVVAAAMASDHRIRYVRLAENSGGCSAPRNRGIDEALGSWIMFCDSDDVYERHAAKNLLLAVEGAEADLGCAVAERVDVATGRARRWHAELHEPAILEGIMDRPELIADTISVNKIYRTSWVRDAGMRFPEGILYEDQLFTMQAFASARRIVVLEETSYRWYVEREPSEASITQRRAELRNAASRVAVNRLIDAYLLAIGRSDLRQVKDAKFLRHDLALHAAALLEADDVTGSAIARELAEYLRTLDLSGAGDLQPGLRIATYHLLVGDLECVRAAMRQVSWGGSLDVPVVADDAGTAWGCQHLAQGPKIAGFDPRWWLDLSDIDPLLVPVSMRPWCHVLSTIDADHRELRVTGSTVDAFSCLSEVRHARLALTGPMNALLASMPLTLIPATGERWTWSGSSAFATEPGAAILQSSHGSVVLVLDFADGTRTITPIRSTRRPALITARPTGIRSYGTHPPDMVEISSATAGMLTWRARRRVHRGVLRRLVTGWDRLGELRLGMAKWALQHLAALLPLRSAVVFSAGDGRRLDGDPRALSRSWHESMPHLKQLWVHAGTPARVPAWAVGVDRRSLRYHWEMARARWWVDDHGIPRTVRKRRRQRNLQTGFGVPIVRVGSEDPQWLLAARAARRPAPATVARWDGLLLASPFADVHVADALGFTGERIEECWPWLQNVVGRHRDGVSVAAVRDRRPRILIAPVHPLLLSGGLDLTSLAQGVGRAAAMVVRRPDGRAVPVAPGMHFSVIDAADDDDTAGLVASADLLITDGSAWAVAASAIDIPVLWFEPRDVPADVEPLRRAPGFTIPDDVMRPVATSTQEVLDLLRRWLDDPQAWPRREEAVQHDLAGLAGSAATAPNAMTRAWAALQGRR